MISKSQIKHIRALHTKKERLLENRFIAEGVKTVAEILEQKPGIIHELFCTADFYDVHQKALHTKKIKVIHIDAKELSQISQLNTPNEVLAVCNNLPEHINSTDLNTAFAFYLDDIRDPGNLGTIIRICSWFGIKDLFCSEETVELYNPKCIQASMGAFLRVNVHYLELKELIAGEKIKNVHAAGLEGRNIYSEPLNTGLIIIGNEANGIRKETLQLATHTITIPSASGNTESLNAAIATSIIASEFFRRNLQ
jgi:RNA methyltransferase, TrmH family